MSPHLVDFVFRYRTVHGRDTKTGEHVTRHYPYVPAILTAPIAKTLPVEGLLDSGSDSVVIPLYIARALKLDLEKAPQMKVVGHLVERYISKVDITLGRAGHYCDTLREVEVSIPAEGDAPVIFGRKPIFELFRITFVEAEHRFSMEPYSADIHRKAARDAKAAGKAAHRRK